MGTATTTTELQEEMRIARMSVGYLVNFGHKNTLEWKRFILTDPQ